MNHSGCSQLNSRWAVQEEESAVTDDPPRVIIRTCRHIKDNGCFCQAAAVSGRAYCRAHLSLRARRRKMARACRRAGVLKLPPLVDLRAVEVGMVRIRVALEAGHIDACRARLLRWSMRQIASTFASPSGKKRSARSAPQPATRAQRQAISLMSTIR